MTAETYDDLSRYVGSKDDFTEDLLNMGYTKGRADAIEEVKERFQNEISFTRIQKQLMIYILDKMKGEK